MTDLNERAAAAAIAAVAERLAERVVDRRVPRIRYGIVQAVNAAARSVDVTLNGGTEISAGFIYGTAAPAVGDLVRVVLEPTGGRFVDDVLGRDAAAMTQLTRLSPSGAADYLARIAVEADAAYRLEAGLDAAGAPFLAFGDGAVVDVRARRTAAETLTLDDGAGGAMTLLALVGAAKLGLDDVTLQRLVGTVANDRIVDVPNARVEARVPAVAWSGSASTAVASGTLTTLTGAMTVVGNDPWDIITAGAASKVTIPAGLGGLWVVLTGIAFGAAGAGTYRRGQVRKNAAAVELYTVGMTASLGVTIPVLMVGAFAAGDTIDFGAQHNQGVSDNVSVASGLAFRVGPAPAAAL